MLNDKTVSEFTNLLGSDAPAPGGGSAAALMGALGVSLTGMVAALTVGKSKYAAYHTQMEQIKREADGLRGELLTLMEEDTAVFNQVAAAYALPRDNEQEKLARTDAIQAALRCCTETPYQMMCVSMQALRLTERALEGYNTNAASDLGVAALGLGAAIRSAWLNILINLGSIADAGFSARYRAEGEALLADALPLSERIYQVIMESL
ncbi:MAG: cyclodeaminase/cyclohydrolase family protein [Coriobacteriia bacterium]|nr:cyclodeaminase/cyclohydrolase family protein [Coriobacteriia bacterium]